MRRRLRVDVREGERVLILGHALHRDLASDDLAEEAVHGSRQSTVDSRQSRAKEPAHGRLSTQKSFFESNNKVTGPSLTMSTVIVARKTPSATVTPRSRTRAQKRA